MLFAIALVILAALWFSYKGDQDRQTNRTSPIIIACGVLAVIGVVLLQAYPVLFFGK